MKKIVLTLVSLCLLTGIAISAQEEPVISNGVPVWPQYYNGTNFRNPRIDASTRSLQIIDYFHHEIHSGSAYGIENFAVLASGATRALVFWTPDSTKETHIWFSVASTNVTEVAIIEGIQALGTGATPFYYNHHRRSGNTSYMTAISLNPPRGFTAGSGTTLKAARFGTSGSVQRQSVGGNVGSNNEIILKSGTTYVLYIVSGAADNVVSYAAEWYEHTPKSD